MGDDIQELLAPAHLNRFGLDSFRLKGSGDAVEFYNLPVDLGEKALKIGAYEVNDIQLTASSSVMETLFTTAFSAQSAFLPRVLAMFLMKATVSLMIFSAIVLLSFLLPP